MGLCVAVTVTWGFGWVYIISFILACPITIEGSVRQTNINLDLVNTFKESMLTSYQINCRTSVIVISTFGTRTCRVIKVLGCKWRSIDGLKRIVTRSIKQGASSKLIFVACRATDPGSPIGRCKRDCRFYNCGSQFGVLRSSLMVILKVQNSALFNI
jgi:hypothetical protein